MKTTFLSSRLVLCLLTLTPTALFAQQADAPDEDPYRDQFSLSVMYWRPDGQPGFRAGDFVADPTTRTLDLSRRPNRANGFMVTVPTGSFNRLEIGAWRASDSGTVFAPAKLSLFGANIREGERLETKYRITNFRIAWNYLTFPAPPFGAKLRIKTFWEFQYTQFTPEIAFPEARAGTAPISPKQSIKYPGAGLGFEYRPFSAFRIEGRGSGMAWPGRSGYWDAEVMMVGRIKMIELFAGAKAYHFHTSKKKNDAIIQGTLYGPAIGLRWVIR